MPNSRNATRWRVLIVATLMAAGPAIAALGQTSPDTGDPGGRRVVAESRFDVTNPPLQAELVLLVVDFPPGAWTSWHTHGGQAINLVVEGEITLRHAGMEQPHRAGQGPSALRQASSWPVKSRTRSARSGKCTRRGRPGRPPLAHRSPRRTGRPARPASSGPICRREGLAGNEACRFPMVSPAKVICGGLQNARLSRAWTSTSQSSL